MTLENPDSLLDVFLPSQSENLERSEFRLAHVGEEVSVDHRVEKPLPILVRHIRDEPVECAYQSRSVWDSIERRNRKTHQAINL